MKTKQLNVLKNILIRFKQKITVRVGCKKKISSAHTHFLTIINFDFVLITALTMINLYQMLCVLKFFTLGLICVLNKIKCAFDVQHVGVLGTVPPVSLGDCGE